MKNLPKLKVSVHGDSVILIREDTGAWVTGGFAGATITERIALAQQIADRCNNYNRPLIEAANHAQALNQ